MVLLCLHVHPREPMAEISRSSSRWANSPASIQGFGRASPPAADLPRTDRGSGLGRLGPKLHTLGPCASSRGISRATAARHCSLIMTSVRDMTGASGWWEVMLDGVTIPAGRTATILIDATTHCARFPADCGLYCNAQGALSCAIAPPRF